MPNEKGTSSGPDFPHTGGGFVFDSLKETLKKETPGETIRRLTDEEVGQSVREKLQHFFPSSVLHAPGSDGKNLLEKIMSRADAEMQRRLLEGLIILATDQELLAMRLKVLPDLSTMEQKEVETFIHDFVERFEKSHSVRIALVTFLNTLLLKGETGPESAFMDEEERKINGKHITAYLSEIEKYVQDGPPQKGSNVLFYKGRPHFLNMSEMFQYLAMIEQAGIRTKDKNASAALDRVQRLRAALTLLKEEANPVANAQYEFLKNQDPSILRKPLMLAGFAAGSLFACMSGFPALWHWWKKGKTPSQAEVITTVAWASVPLVISGALKGAPEGLPRVIEKEMQIIARPEFRMAVQKAGVALSLEALDEFSDLLRSKKFAEMKRIAYADSAELSLRTLEKLLDVKVEPGKVPKSRLLSTLAQVGDHALTDRERKEFFSTAFLHLKDRKIQSLEELKAILQTEKVMLS